MPTHTIHTKKEETYFTTFTCFDWMNLFEEAKLYDYFDKWFQYLNDNQVYILGYVIMPNHFHGLLHISEKCKLTLNRLVGNGKRFLAYEVVKQLKKKKKEELLTKLQSGVSENEKILGKKHQVFRLSFDAKVCHHKEMLESRLDYIHYNPISGKWMLVKDWATYPYSSAAFYEIGDCNKFVTHYKDIWG